jgi:hypothetical protein
MLPYAPGMIFVEVQSILLYNSLVVKTENVEVCVMLAVFILVMDTLNNTDHCVITLMEIT